jgi:hypothetical protein
MNLYNVKFRMGILESEYLSVPATSATKAKYKVFKAESKTRKECKLAAPSLVLFFIKARARIIK